MALPALYLGLNLFYLVIITVINHLVLGFAGGTR
jgi:hypothetical protein